MKQICVTELEVMAEKFSLMSIHGFQAPIET